MTKKKILFFIDSLNSGGAQRQMVTLAANVDRTQYEPIVVIYHDLRHFQSILDIANVPVFLIKKNRWVDIKYFLQLRKFIKSFEPDVILSYLNTPNMWARVAGRASGVKNIITSERDSFLVNSRKRMAIEFLLKGLSSKIVVNTNPIKDMLDKKVKIPREKIHVIYNGVDTCYFASPDRKKTVNIKGSLSIKDNEHIILLPGRLVREKNHKCLIKAFSLISEKHKTSKLLFVGEEKDHELKSELVSLIENYGLNDRVVFAGQRNDMRACYALSSLVVLPSLWEGFPNVILEAMASSKAVVASAIADNHILINEGKSGFLFPSDNDVVLAEKIDQILREETLMMKMGEEGLKQVKEKYSVSNMVNQYEHLFFDLIQKKVN